jgi:hypothetical protein
MNESLPLPPYLAPLSQSDPRWAELNSSAYEYAYGPKPGDGNLESFQIVVFLEMHHAYRVWGGPASECGYWWILAPPSGKSLQLLLMISSLLCSNLSLITILFSSDCVDVCPRISTPDYQNIFAVCPEWNSMTNITVVNIPANVRALERVLFSFHIHIVT